ncbi:hypothetical protein C8R48DRAFT_736031 [Suillus tomentosus]|nr:hypothetical protein C8R48DRAFT_736031 [Suillus tomentosus]
MAMPGISSTVMAMPMSASSLRALSMSFSQLAIWSRSIMTEKNLLNNPCFFLETTLLLISSTNLLSILSSDKAWAKYPGRLLSVVSLVALLRISPMISHFLTIVRKSDLILATVTSTPFARSLGTMVCTALMPAIVTSSSQLIFLAWDSEEGCSMFLLTFDSLDFLDFGLLDDITSA